MMGRLNTRKTDIESQLAQPEVYQDGEKVKTLLLDQAYVAKELEQLESEWLELQC
jgi:ATP-binding cassette subfamily F protein 3